ncbi:MAG: threonylcarbamoyl-AMP synthase [Lentisphaeria bacterium]|nr:threonylcarbamoyl-AMP synthase [Lentisphaeria bacterium]
MFFNWQQEGDENLVRELADCLRNPGAVILVPTETVYGLAARISDPAAREKIIFLKHRDPAKHLGWFVPDLAAAEKYGLQLSDAARRLAERFMPGPLTLIVNRADGSTVGFRIPDHPLLLKLLRELGEPLLQTSANRSGFPNALSCAEASAMLCGEPDAVVDGGDILPGALASTIVDCTGETPRIIRQGALDVKDLIP